MTCTHVLGLIDAGPFADYPRVHLDAAWQHARQCARCGSALEAATALSTDLAGLPQPAPTAALAAAVLARIAQAGQVQAARGAAALPATGSASITRDWSAWATAFGGLATGLVVVLSMGSGGGAWVSIASPRVGGITAGLVAVPMTTDALVLAAALVLYAAGLFAPLSRGGRT